MLPFLQRSVDLEAHLGDPLDPARPLSLASAVALDEAEAFPEASVRLLEDWGFLRSFIPQEVGGALTSFDELLALMRTLSRRDLTTAISVGQTFLGAVPVWVGGTSEQKARLAGLLNAGGHAALALTEEQHGSDLLGCEVSARPQGEGYSLNGEKWLINNGSRAAALTVLARTDPAGGLGGFSLFLAERAQAKFGALKKMKTHGIRGADISGARFDQTVVGPGALLGGLGAGLDLVLKCLQVSRVGCAAFSLGAGDTALRLTLDWAIARQLYGTRVVELGTARAALVDAFIDLLTNECLALAGTRAAHLAPEQLSIASSVVKFVVPTSVDALLRELAIVLGARHYLREGHGAGAFQKIIRDHAVVSLFDGSTAVNLDAVSRQLWRLVAPGQVAEEGRLAKWFDLTAPLPPFDASALAILNDGRDDVSQGLAAAADLLPATDSALRELLARQLAALVAQQRADAQVLAAAAPRRRELGRSPQLFDLARRYTYRYGAACCLRLWLHSRGVADPFFLGGDWLALALARLVPEVPVPPSVRVAVADELLRLHRERRSFSLFPVRLP